MNKTPHLFKLASIPAYAERLAGSLLSTLTAERPASKLHDGWRASGLLLPDPMPADRRADDAAEVRYG